MISYLVEKCVESYPKHGLYAVAGALFLDGGIDLADKIFGEILYGNEEEEGLLSIWQNLAPHPLQVRFYRLQSLDKNE